MRQTALTLPWTRTPRRILRRPEKKKRSTGALVAIFVAVAVVVGAIVYIALNWSTVFGGQRPARSTPAILTPPPLMS